MAQNNNWRETTLGEVLTLQRGFDLPEAEREIGFHPIVASTGPVGMHSRAMVSGPGVVIGRSGSLGGGQFIKTDFWPLNTTLWVKDFKNNDPHFCYFLLKSIDLTQFNVGSGVPTLNRNHIHPLVVSIPSNVTEQRRIAHILGTLDDKIENNRKTAKTLEAIAQAIFQSWFVNFDPVRAKMAGESRESICKRLKITPEILDLFPDRLVDSELGEIPEGWTEVTVESVANIGIGKTPPRKEHQWFSTADSDTRWVSIRDMGDSGMFLQRTSEFLTNEAVKKFNVRVIPDNTIILSFKLTVGRVAITDGEMVTNEAIAHFNITDQSHLSTEYLYCYLRQFDFTRLSSTSSIATAINSNGVKGIPVLLPIKVIASNFSTVVSPTFHVIKWLLSEALVLSQIRDTILPKLISGEIRVPDAEHLIQDAEKITP